jgi:hypothetical protein
MHGSKQSFYDTARIKSPVLKKIYNDYISSEDMAGNADAYSLKFYPNKTICESMKEYYDLWS